MLKLSQICARKTLNLQISNAIRTIAVQSSVQRSRYTPLLSDRNVFKGLNRQQYRVLDREISAAINLVSRSFNVPRNDLIRSLHTTCSKFQQRQPPPPPNQNSGSGGNEPGKDPKKGKNDKESDAEKMMSVITKTLLWMFTIYIMIAFVSLLLTGRSRPPHADQQPGQTRYISW